MSIENYENLNQVLKAMIVDELNKNVGELNLNPFVFDVPFDNKMVHTYLRWQAALARDRSGLTQKAKNRSEVNGAHRKIRRQKGTGGARHGDGKAPQFRSGGVAFGINPRSYEFKMNLKERALALASVVSHKLRNAGLVILDEKALDKIDFSKTKNVKEFASAFGKNVLLVANNTKSMNTRGIKLAQGVDIIPTDALNVRSCAHAKIVFIGESAISNFQNILENRLVRKKGKEDE